jgi:hypothetical protein
MRAASKTILFARHAAGTKVTQHPIAVFASPASAKTYASVLTGAYKSGDVDSVRRLDPQTPLTDDGKLPSLPKFSAVVAVYEPLPYVQSEEAELEVSSHVS